MRKTFDNGSWFDTDDATSWPLQGTMLDRGVILWRTRKGTFVLETEGEFGEAGELSLMTEDEGVVWLIRNGHDVPVDLQNKQADLEIYADMVDEDPIGARLSAMEHDLEGVKADINRLKIDVNSIKTDMEYVKGSLTKLEEVLHSVLEMKGSMPHMATAKDVEAAKHTATKTVYTALGSFVLALVAIGLAAIPLIS